MARRQAASAALVKAESNAGALVHRPPAGQFVDISGLADERYAIAEDIVEAERRSCPNWMQKQHLQFEQDHGQWLQPPGEDCGDEEDDDQDGQDMCQCPVDLCARDAERLDDYHTWFGQCKTVLRIFRTLRKTKGFPPDHPLIIVTTSEVGGIHDLTLNDGGDGGLVYLFAKVAFSPFDATLVKLKLQPMGPDVPLTWVARMHSTHDGLPDVISLDTFLKHCCESFDGENDRIQILDYCGGRKLGELDIKSMETIESVLEKVTPAAPGPVDGDADLEEDKKDAKKRLELLKRALGKDTQKQTRAKPKAGPRPVPKPKAVNRQMKQIQKNQSQLEGQDPNGEDDGSGGGDPDEPGVAGAAHALIEKEWVGALESELPQVEQAPNPSSSSSSSARPREQPPPSPSTLPWKDDRGYCFYPCDGKAKGRYLGASAQLSLVWRFAK